MIKESIILDLQHIHASYGPIEVLKGVSLQVQQGEIVTLIGANGAGKTTLLLCISGVKLIKRGSISLHGEHIHDLPAHELVSRGCAHVPEGRKIFSRLTCSDAGKIC